MNNGEGARDTCELTVRVSVVNEMRLQFQRQTRLNVELNVL